MGQSFAREWCCCFPCFDAPKLALGDTKIKKFPHRVKYPMSHADCERLYFAVIGLGTNEHELIEILCNRTVHQRVEIARLYKENYGKELGKVLADDTSFNFKNLLVALTEKPHVFLAKQIHKATARLGTDDSDLVEILTTASNMMVYKMRKSYLKQFGKPLEEVIISETSGNYQRLLLKCLKGHRDESNVIVPLQVTIDVQRLYEMGQGRLGTDDEGFIQFFCTRSPAHLAAVDKEYFAKYHKRLADVISDETSFNYAKCLKSLATPRDEFFAHCLHEAIARLGTDDNALIRIIVRHNKSDLRVIADFYDRKYGKSLVRDVKGDTSGWYGKALVACIEGTNPQGDEATKEYVREEPLMTVVLPLTPSPFTEPLVVAGPSVIAPGPSVAGPSVVAPSLPPPRAGGGGTAPPPVVYGGAPPPGAGYGAPPGAGYGAPPGAGYGAPPPGYPGGAGGPPATFI